jgi:hypothetical protein
LCRTEGCGVRRQAEPEQQIEAQVSEEFIAEFQDVYAKKCGNYGRTHELYHWVDTDDARPIRQPRRRLPLGKQARVNGMLKDMKKR